MTVFYDELEVPGKGCTLGVQDCTAGAFLVKNSWTHWKKPPTWWSHRETHWERLPVL